MVEFLKQGTDEDCTDVNELDPNEKFISKKTHLIDETSTDIFKAESCGDVDELKLNEKYVSKRSHLLDDRSVEVIIDTKANINKYTGENETEEYGKNETVCSRHHISLNK